MNIVQYNPNRWFESAFNRFFSDFSPSPALDVAVGSSFTPRVEIRDEKDAVIVSAEIPGVEKSDLTVEVADGILTLSGTKKQEEVSNEEGVYRAERVYGEFKRAFSLPDTLDASKIDAQYRNGVLKVTLPKKPEAAPKQIEIRGDAEARKIGVN